MNTEGEARHMY